MALTYKALGDIDNTIKAYNKAIELNPSKYNAYYNLSLLYKDKKNIVKAVYYAEKCLEINSEDEEVYSLLSNYFEDLKVIHDMNKFKEMSDVIIANRLDDNLKDCRNSVYTRDIFSRD